MDRRCVFLDLNGTIVEQLKPQRLDALTLIPGVAEAVARLSAAGFVCPVVTVQSRIAKGLFSLAQFETWFAGFAADLNTYGARVVGPYVGPHRFAEPCPCKKPNTVLYERAARRLGARGCLVRTGWATDSHVAETAAPDASVVLPSLGDPVDWILAS